MKLGDSPGPAGVIGATNAIPEPVSYFGTPHSSPAMPTAWVGYQRVLSVNHPLDLGGLNLIGGRRPDFGHQRMTIGKRIRTTELG